MPAAERRLMPHLVIAVAVKLAVLAGLWWGFVRDRHVAVDPEQAAAHIAGEPSRPGARP